LLDAVECWMSGIFGDQSCNNKNNKFRAFKWIFNISKDFIKRCYKPKQDWNREPPFALVENAQRLCDGVRFEHQIVFENEERNHADSKWYWGETEIRDGESLERAQHIMSTVG